MSVHILYVHSIQVHAIVLWSSILLICIRAPLHLCTCTVHISHVHLHTIHYVFRIADIGQKEQVAKNLHGTTEPAVISAYITPVSLSPLLWISLPLWPIFECCPGHHLRPVPRSEAAQARLPGPAGGHPGELREDEPTDDWLLHREDPADLRDDDRASRLHAGGRALRGQNVRLSGAGRRVTRHLWEGEPACHAPKTACLPAYSLLISNCLSLSLCVWQPQGYLYWITQSLSLSANSLYLLKGVSIVSQPSNPPAFLKRK